MRATSLLRKLLGITFLFVIGVDLQQGSKIMADVRPRWRRPRCGVCGKTCPGYDTLPARYWRHLGPGNVTIWLRYAPRRVHCSDCGVKTEELPWAACAKTGFTKDFEETVAYLAQITDKTTVCKLAGIAWRTVGRIVERVVDTRLDPDRLVGVRRIGIDEFSYRKRHRYITVVVDHDRSRVIWAAKGKSSEVLEQFFDALGEEGCKLLEYVTIDMSAAYEKAVRARAPQAEIAFDRFHVQALASKAVDEVRRELVSDLKGTDEAKAVKKSRWVLLKNPWNLTRKQRLKLSEVQETNKPLYRAYLLKEELARALDYRQIGRAREALDGWLAWASRSKLEPFIKLARTIRKHKDDILRYVKLRLTNALVEGINNRMRMVARRSYGFHGAKPLMAMLFLCCGGLTLNPPLPHPGQPT